MSSLDFPLLSSPLIAKMLMVIKYLFLIKSYYLKLLKSVDKYASTKDISAIGKHALEAFI